MSARRDSPLDHKSILVRPTRAADGDRLRDLRLEAIASCPTVFGSSVEETHEIDWTDRAARGDGSGHEAIFVAEHAGELLGMTGIFSGTRAKDKHAGNIWGVYVRPAWRGLRIADRLVTTAVDWARSKRLAIVRLTVVAENTTAQECYVRCGFGITGVDRASLAWEGRYYDELLMSQWLNLPAATV